ncbi:MAG: Re/Si-specific NAD(P)(+) transhydrogenase subunit alpha [Myxococcota bacterium]
MIVAVGKERLAGERRVALVPDGVQALVKAGLEVRVEAGAGAGAMIPDADFEAAGARIEPDRSALLAAADLWLAVGPPDDALVSGLREGAALISLLRPLDEPARIQALAARRIATFSLELVPRITRAQSMDVLSSQATLAGYRAVLLAALRLPELFPMLVTAAGTIKPARVFVIGAGVAGLQAIATAKRLGAIVEAYDTRAAAAEQIESLGGRFVSFELDAGDAQDAGGYAKAQTEDFYAKQREFMAQQAGKSEVVISTALVPGRRAPLLLDEAGVRGMKPGSVVVDLAAQNGGNCEVTRADEDVEVNGTHVLGPTNLASDAATDASRMFSRNVVNLVEHLVDEGKLTLDREDEITKGTLVAVDGEVVNEMVQKQLGASA